MFKFGECWKCNTIQNSKILNHKLPFDVCQRICEYNKCDTCRNKIETMNNFDESSYWSKGNKVQRIILHLLFRNFDIDTRMDRRKYKNIIKRSTNPQRKIMKQFINISHNVDKTSYTLYGVCHVSLMYSIITRLHDTDKVLVEIERYNLKTATFRFNGFTLSKEVILKEIIRECFDFWLVGWRDYYNTTTEEIMEYVDYVFSL